ncbi:MAG: DUF5667 domain-containing protein [Patescibacteria group bacterium]
MLIKRIKELKTGQPNPEWVGKNRDILLSVIKAQRGADLQIFSKAGANFTWQAVTLFFPSRLAAKVTAAIFVMFVLVFGSSITTVWADRSLPGDILYPVKLTTERMQVALTMADQDKANLEVEFAGRRLEEFKKVKEDQTKVQEPLKNFQDNLTTAAGRLEKLQSAGQTQEATALAGTISKQTKEYADILNKENIEDNTPAVQESLKVSEATSDKALVVIVENYKAGEAGAAISQEVAGTLNEKISSTEERINKINQLIKDLVKVEDTAVTATTSAELPPTSLDPAEELTAAEKLLAEAKELLLASDLNGSLAKVQFSQEILSNIEAVIIKQESNPVVPDSTVPIDNTNTNTNIAPVIPVTNTNTSSTVPVTNTNN